MTNTINRTVAIGLSLLILIFAGTAPAETGSEGLIKYRRALMKSLAGHLKASAEIVKGTVPYGDNLALHAEGMKALQKDLVRYFPEGTEQGETNAKPAIWRERAKFREKAEANKKAGADFAAAVAGGDTAVIGKTFGAVGKSCRGCHKSYRKKKN